MNDTALITGASSGIGMELARLHARQKGDLVLVARSTSKLLSLKEELEEKYGIEVVTMPKDLSIPGAAEEVYEAVQSDKIVVHYLINSAGFGDYGRFVDTDPEREEMMINLNVLTMTQLCKFFGKEMMTREEGRIMNLGSDASCMSGPFMAVYCATKHYVLAFSDALSLEMKGTGVTVTCLCPGPVASDFYRAAGHEEYRQVKDRKLPSPREVAAFGYARMLQGKKMAVYGWKNRLKMLGTGLGSARILPKKYRTKR